MINIWPFIFIGYWVLSILVVLHAIKRFPSRTPTDEGERVVVFMLAWLICPVALYDLWSKRHLTTTDWIKHRDRNR